MIPRAEIQRLAAQSGVRVTLQERDYVLGCFLLALARTPALVDQLAFKGGTALRKIYFPVPLLRRFGFHRVVVVV